MEKLRMSRVSRVLALAGVSVLLVALVLAMAAPALAAPNSPASWVDDFDGEFLTGEVLSIGDQEFVIQSGEEELTIAVNEDTLYYQLSVPDRVRAWLQQRLQARQLCQEQLQAQEQNNQGQGPGQGSQNRRRVEVATCGQLRLQSQLCQMEGALQTETLCCRWLRNFGEEAEFADIAVGDSVAVWVVEGANLAQAVLITKPTA